MTLDPKKVEEFILGNPAVMVAIIGLASLQYLVSETKKPAWLKDCPPIGGRRAGPWRGKGSFGHGFGPSRVKHR